MTTAAKQAARTGSRPVRIRAFAKINLSLQVLGVRPDGYHEIRTTFQTIALHDTLSFVASPGPFEIRCSDPACPVDRANLVYRAAELVWRAAGRRGPPEGVCARIRKRIPMQSGLGGGSSDAAAALRALAAIWRVKIGPAQLKRLARTLGADVPFFLDGGAALGVNRGDRLRPLADAPASWVVLVLPDFGVSTKDAYAWWDERKTGRASGSLDAHRVTGNDLEAPVAARYPEISKIAAALHEAGASRAAMSGSGSAVFGLFETRRIALAAARTLAGRACRTLVTRTLDRASVGERARPESG